MISGLLVLARMAARNVRKHWRHSLGSILSIAVGFVAIGLFSGYLDDLAGSQARAISQRNMMGDLIIEHVHAFDRAHRDDFWGHQLGEREQTFIDAYLNQRVSDVSESARFLDFMGLASSGKGGAVFIGLGYDVAEGEILRGEIKDNAIAGAVLRADQSEQVQLARGLGAALDCLPAETAADAKPGLACRRPRVQLSATTEQGQLNVVEPTVVGLVSAGLKELDARMLMMPLPLAQRLNDTTKISRVMVQLSPGVDALAFGAALSEAARKEGVPVHALRWQDHRFGEVHRRGMELLGLFRSFVVVIVVAIAAMSVLMTMMRAVSERTREVGMLRSLGFLRRHIVSLFLLEAGVLALVSCGVGAVATAILSFAFNHSGISYKAGVVSDPIPLGVALVPSVWLSALLFLSTVAMLAAFLPARHAARMKIPEALGHV